MDVRIRSATKRHVSHVTEYETRLLDSDDAETMARQAERFVAWVSASLGSQTGTAATPR